MAASDREEQLARLEAQQRRDDRRRRLPNRGPIVREADLSTGRRRFDLRDFGPNRDAGPSKFRGRTRRAWIPDDAGSWHETTATGRRFRFTVILLGINPWEAAVQAAVDRGDCTCPVCNGAIRPRDHLDADGLAHCCGYCNAADTDRLAASGRLEYAGIEPDSVLNPCAAQYPAAPTTYRKARGGNRLNFRISDRIPLVSTGWTLYIDLSRGE